MITGIAITLVVFVIFLALVIAIETYLEKHNHKCYSNSEPSGSFFDAIQPANHKPVLL